MAQNGLLTQPHAKGAIYIQAWASALLVLTTWAMRRPQAVGRVTVKVPRFFRKYTNQPYENNRRIRESSCQCLKNGMIAGLIKSEVMPKIKKHYYEHAT